MIADCAAGPLKDLLQRANAGITTVTWANLALGKSLSIYVTQNGTSGGGTSVGPFVSLAAGTPNVLSTFLNSADGDRMYPLWRLAMFCGLRRDEFTGLAWAEVDFDEGVLWVRETGGGDGPKSESGMRSVPVPDRALAVLRGWRRQQAAERLAWGPAWTDTGLVFTHEDGTALSGQWISRRFALLAFRAALPPVRFHDLRHGTGSLLKAAGVDTKVISAILGHAKTSFTDAVYVNVFPDVSRAAVNAAEGIVSQSRKEGTR